MSPITLILMAIGLGLAGWLVGRAKAWSFQKVDPSVRPAARPAYHAWYVALWIIIPVLAFVVAWSFIAPALVTQSVLASPGAADLPSFGFEREAWLAEARAVATGNAPGVFNEGAEALVEPFREAIGRYNLIGYALTIIIAFGGGGFCLHSTAPRFRARTRVERTVMTILLLASLVAILTTFGIVASLVFETMRFFTMVSPVDFLFGTFWAGTR